MVNDPSHTDTEALGQFLQRQRVEKGIDLLEAAEETRIPQETLSAMETGDYASLPADAFARGFYSIYARLLQLDSNNILDRYTQERNASLVNQPKTVQTPSRLGKTVSPMAERPLITPLSILGFSLVIVILIIVAISWFFSWNPANFLSTKLRSFGKESAIEQKTDTRTSSGSSTSADKTTARVSPDKTKNEQAKENQTTDKYTLQAEFQEPTKVTVAVDEEFPKEVTFSAGQTQTWHAKGNIVLALPPNTKTRLTMNAVLLPAPEPGNGFITVSIPGSQQN